LLSYNAIFFLLFSLAASKLHDGMITRQKRMSDKGIYVTGYMVQTPRVFNKIKAAAKAAGINTFVVDAKMFLEKELIEAAKEKKIKADFRVTPSETFAKIVKELHSEGFIVSARIVVFKDDHLVIARPDLSVKKKDGSLYRDLKMGRWADPYSPEVQLYNQLIAERAALSGADEVQFDYVRFPAERGAKEAVYPAYDETLTKVDVITGFLAGTRARLKKYNTSIAVDIFGVTAWQSKVDITALGQDLKRMAKYIDVISPMLYPSHFHNGYDGFANPGAEPYYFLNKGVKQTLEILSGEAVTVVPWIQGFNMKSPNYGPQYIREQIRACRDNEVKGFLVWNARNDYTTTFQALSNYDIH